MKVGRSVGIILLGILASVTSVDAHKAEQVRRELQAQGYDQIEFKRKKVPFWIDACLGAELFHLHVDYYGKITKKTATGPCPGRESPADTAIETEGPSPGRAVVVNENSSITTARQEADKTVKSNAIDAAAEPVPQSKGVDKSECKRFFPATGMTLTVTCE